MSFMEKLLKNTHIVWHDLGEISEIYGGLSGKNKADFEDGNAKYISYKNIFNNIEINFDNLDSVKVSTSENQHKVKYGDVLFTGSSETANEAGMSSSVTVNFDEKIYLNSFSFGLRFNDDIQIMPEFSKYLFRSHFMRIEIAKTASGVTRFNVSKARFKKIQIPIPPLHVQREIVRILDNFTELTAELTAELSARKKQYSYYRDQLLSFEEGEVEFKPLGEIGELVRGNGLPKTDFTETGVPAIHYGQIYTYYGTFTTETKSFVSKETAKKLKKVNTGDVVITNTSENLEDVGKAVVYLGEVQAVTGGHATIFKPSKYILGKYFAYFTQTSFFASQKRKYAKGTKVIDVSATDMSKILIPMPPIVEQERIVSILDKFDALTNSITEGLPREIKLRQKQYEYYRDILLSFEKVETEA
jgi:type I restriction enzyme, S subunit